MRHVELTAVEELTFVHRFRYDGLYVVDQVSSVPPSGHHILIFAKAEMRPGTKGFTMCFFELRVRDQSTQFNLLTFYQRIQEEGVGPIPTRRLLDGKKLNRVRKAAKAK